MDDSAVSAAAAEIGIEAAALSRFHYTQDARPGLILGFGAAPPHAIEEGVARLADLFSRLAHQE